MYKLKNERTKCILLQRIVLLFLDDMDNAILNLKSYINSVSDSPEAYFDLALCLKQKENTSEAINYLSEGNRN